MSEHDRYLTDAGTLLNAADARVDLRKLVTYSLDPGHSRGGHKAYVFSRVLGYDRSNADELATVIRAGVLTARARPGPIDHQGVRFNVDFEVQGPTGRRAVVRTGWIYPPGEWIPVLTTAFIRRGGTRAQTTTT